MSSVRSLRPLLTAAALLILQACQRDATPVAPAFDVRRSTGTGALSVTTISDAGPGSLREALALATDGTVITIDEALAGKTIILGEDLVATRAIEVNGPLGGPLVIDGGGRFHTIIDAGALEADQTWRRIIFRNGGVATPGAPTADLSTNSGGNVFIRRGGLALELAVVERGRAFMGGGVFADAEGRLSLLATRVSDNVATTNGGGIFTSAFGLVANRSMIRGNRAGQAGGGVSLLGTALFTLSSLVENRAGTNGGGVNAATGSSVIFRNATIARNEAVFNGAMAVDGKVRLEFSTLAWNTGTASISAAELVSDRSILQSDNPLCTGGVRVAALANVITDNSGTCFSALPPVVVVADPMLGDLQYASSGLRAWIPLRWGSPAIDAAPTCDLLTDIVGTARPQGPTCELGSFEFTDYPVARLGSAVQGAVNAQTGVVLLSGSLTCTADGTVPLSLSLQQAQKAGKVNTTIVATTSLHVPCTGGTALWSVYLTPPTGAFSNGAASLSATVGGANGFVTTSATTPVKMFWAK